MVLFACMTASPPVLAWVATILAIGGPGVGASLSPDTAALLHGQHVEYAPGLMARAATNLQTFTGDLAGVTADAITQSTDTTRPYEVDGDTFGPSGLCRLQQDYATAAGRSCDNQHNSCADAVNSKDVTNVTVSDCDTQNSECKAAAASATQTAFTVLTTSNADYDFFCDL